MADQLDEDTIIAALSEQPALHSNQELVNQIRAVSEIIYCDEGKVICEQGELGTNMFFILFGAVQVIVNGNYIATRQRKEHIGEMSLIDCGASRSATLMAEKNTILAKVERADFSTIAKKHSELWPDIAKPIAERLRQRNDREREKNKKPRIFIGSSSESATILKSLVLGLENPDFDIMPWTKEGVFTASSHVIEDLEKEAQRCDFAIFIFGPDDKIFSRLRWLKGPRDNVVFELGLFMGALKRERTYIVQPQKPKLKIPSDLLGLTSLRFDQDANEVCGELIGLINGLGPR